MRGVVSDYESMGNFNKCFIDVVKTYLKFDPEVEGGIQRLFLNTSGIDEFKNKKVVLIMDEIDSIARLPP